MKGKKKKERKPGIYRILWKNIRSLVQFEVFYKLLFLLAFIPLLTQIVSLSLNITGYRYITVDNFASYLSHPVTILFAILLMILVAIFNFYDISAIIYNTDQSYQNRKTNLSEMVKFASANLKKLLKPKNLIFFWAIDIILPFISIGLAWSYFRMISLSDLLLSLFRRKWYYVAITVTVILLLWFVFMRWIYCFHYFSMDGSSFLKACQKSRRLSRKNRMTDMVKLILLPLSYGLVFILLFMAGTVVITFATKLFVKGTMVEAVSYSIIVVYLNILLLLFIALVTPFSFVCITSMFFKHKNKQQEEIPHIEKIQVVENRKHRRRLQVIEFLIIIVSLTVSGIYIFLLHTGRVNFNIEYVKNLDVTAHRGASALYPENSRSAFEGAIALGANWIELDVQQTKDGQIIIMHDTNLKRTTGVDRNIWEMNYADLQQLEIGSWFSTEFTGEPIMLLSEAIELAKENNIRLNIELKPTGHEEDFEKHVIDIVKEYGFENECVVTSQVYEVLKRIKNYDPDIYTVYVMSVAYGNIYKLKAADSFSVKHSFITRNLVSTVHNAGKEIYAWTVNSEYQINQMISMNVDNIITDDVIMAQRCIYSSRTSNLVIEFIEKLIGFRFKLL